MTKEDIEEIARAAAREAIREMLIAMGVDASNPAAMIEMQRDLESLRQPARREIKMRSPSAMTT